jgi:Ni/Co efflux regulator RcnB
MITIIAAALAAAQAAPAATSAPVHAGHDQHIQHQQGTQHAHDHQQMARMMEHCKEMMEKERSGQGRPGTHDHREHGGN